MEREEPGPELIPEAGAVQSPQEVLVGATRPGAREEIVRDTGVRPPQPRDHGLRHQLGVNIEVKSQTDIQQRDGSTGRSVGKLCGLKFVICKFLALIIYSVLPVF